MKPYKVRRSKIDNLGLYASRNIKRGAKIIEYKGKVITRREAEENPKYDNDKAIYLFNLNKKYFDRFFTLFKNFLLNIISITAFPTDIAKGLPPNVDP